MQETGFLGTAAPRAAEITLLLEMGMGVGLLAGARLARRGRIRIHAACQSVIVILNLTLIVLTMFPAFHCSPNSQAGLEDPTTRSPQRMRRWAALLNFWVCTYCWRPGQNYFRRSSASRASNSGCEAFSWFGGLFFSLGWPHMLVGT